MSDLFVHLVNSKIEHLRGKITIDDIVEFKTAAQIVTEKLPYAPPPDKLTLDTALVLMEPIHIVITQRFDNKQSLFDSIVAGDFPFPEDDPEAGMCLLVFIEGVSYFLSLKESELLDLALDIPEFERRKREYGLVRTEITYTDIKGIERTGEVVRKEDVCDKFFSTLNASVHGVEDYDELHFYKKTKSPSSSKITKF